MTPRQKIDKALTEVYPQLQINCRKVSGAMHANWGDDLLACCIEIFLKKKIEVQEKIVDDGKIEHYITKLMNFQLKMTNTPFFVEYRDPTNRIREFYDEGHQYSGQDYTTEGLVEKITEERALSCLELSVQKLDPLQQMVYREILVKGKSYNKTAKQYNINYRALRDVRNQVQEILFNACKNIYDDDISTIDY